MPGFVSKHDLVYRFKLSRRADGFKPLWDMEVQTPESAEYETIVDADNLSTAIAKIGFVLERDGL